MIINKPPVENKALIPVFSEQGFVGTISPQSPA
jgi:hypothetical protein